MSIATQITRLNNNINSMKTTKQEIKDAMNNDFDIIANEQIEDYAELIEDGLELYKDCIPSVETEQATEITVNDAMKYGRNKLQLFGNTEQASYEGKNLISISDGTYTGNGYTAIVSNGKITVNGTGAYTPSAVEIPLDNPIDWPDNVPLLLSAFNPEAQGNTSETGDYFSLRIGSENNPNLLGAILGNQNASASRTRTVGVKITRLQIRGYTGGEFNNFVCYPQLELDSNIGHYEPYVGGLPSPNPNYPQDIHVVTGNNTIIVNNTNYPLNLGSLELCKIGDYQDYLYKENGNWYKYGAIEKYVVNNDLTNNAITENIIGLLTPELNIESNLSTPNLGAISLCNTFKTTRAGNNDPSQNTGFSGTTTAGKIRIYMSTIYATTYAEAKQLCADNNLTIYFGAKVPVITQITDETLIAQLEAIWEHLQLEKGTNHITVTASDLKPYMKLSYKNYESNLTSEE